MQVAPDGKAYLSVPIDGANPDGTAITILTFKCTDDSKEARQWYLKPVGRILVDHKNGLTADGKAEITATDAKDLIDGLCGLAHGVDNDFSNNTRVHGHILTNLSTVDADGTEHPVPSCPQQTSCALPPS
jgi:hypothetical protein